jgi:hypothetical protein
MAIAKNVTAVPEIDVNKLPFELTVLDRETLLITDEEYVPDDWETVKQIISKPDFYLPRSISDTSTILVA